MSFTTNFKHELPSRFDAKDAEAKADATHELNVYKLVDIRDKHRCRACGVFADPNAVGVLQRAHRHHVIYRSAGGPTETWNLLTICSKCHNDEHKHTLQIDGNADEGCCYWKRGSDSKWYLWKREIAPFVVERD